LRINLFYSLRNPNFAKFFFKIIFLVTKIKRSIFAHFNAISLIFKIDLRRTEDKQALACATYQQPVYDHRYKKARQILAECAN
jgi:hypothetical protein